MHTVFLSWAIVGLIVHIVFALVVRRGAASIARLRDMPLPDGNEWPRVSVIIPARNEERHIRAALASVLRLDYPDYEVVAVDDRSTDGTGAILDEFAANEPRLRVVHVRELPQGWLGKNHALQHGAEHASGELLLFTDADVVYEPTALRRAVGYFRERQLDHLAALPQMDMPTWLLESFVLTFMLFFSAYFRPWKARDPKSKAFIGVGAFNLVRADAYRDVQGHRPIAMRPDDDVQLGHLFKLRGKRSDVVDAVGMMRVPWYGSVRELIHGLEKNAFSGVDYRIWIVVGSSLVAVAFNILPFVLVFLPVGNARWIFLASVAVILGTCWSAASTVRLRRSAAFGFPLAVALFVYIQWRTMLLTLWQGGIRWRDTFYPLRELKANRVA